MQWKRAALLTLGIILALFFTLQGIVKLIGAGAWVQRFRMWGYPDHFYLIVGCAEIIGAILLVVPRTRRIGAGLLMVVMAGAGVTHAIHHEPQIVSALVLFALLALPAFVRTHPRTSS